MVIDKPGIYEIEHDLYHSDPVIDPSLSCSIARILVRQTPAHAHQAHPRFGSAGMTPTRVMDDGSAVHAMFAGQCHLIHRLETVYGPKTKKRHLVGLPMLGFTNDAIKEERDEVREQGKIPVLHHRLPELVHCYETAMRDMRDLEDGQCFLSPGRSEIAAVSQEGDVWLRALVDRLPDDPRLPPADLKCTEMSAAPGGWERRLQTEYAFQASFYHRVLKSAEGFERPPMRFGVIELDPPHGTTIMAAAPSLQDIADREVERAIQMWRKCIKSNLWPKFPPHTAWVEATPWQVSASIEADFRDEVMESAA